MTEHITQQGAILWVDVILGGLCQLRMWAVIVLSGDGLSTIDFMIVVKPNNVKDTINKKAHDSSVFVL